ncbi:sigma-70 family RNA polymerase sigma factor [Kribbella sp. HUAS MG21]|jgi:RNA polymerase sigma factor (sigma-70 family)|uniref:Sigma-70 family RNA polymerase sigma factor n=1 Tax=Kribbella sp. HUAS MG21 TaxID=3160966 RepID=A0AAU7T8L5_9ACTN
MSTLVGLPAAEDLEEAVRTFVEVRPRLMAIGYRLLASRTEAEDIVQETWVRWQTIDRTTVLDPPALLATITRRLAINVLDSAHRRHESSVPVIDPASADPRIAGAVEDPVAAAETREGVEEALRIVLERLTARERAAFVLHDVFGYSYPQIADILHVRSVNCRQLVSRARGHLAAERHAAVSAAGYRRFRDEFAVAARSGDLSRLREMLAEDLAG